MTPRIGLFGGSFDPVHNAHLALASAAREALALDELRWIPAGQPWQKEKARAITPAPQRLAMLELALQGRPGHVIDRIEIDRSGPSYTIDTVRALQAAHPAARLVLIVGQDQYGNLHTWHDWRELLSRVDLAVAGRPGANAAVDERVALLGAALVPLPPMAISATEIRQRVAAGLPIDHLVPAAVAGYIAHEALYRSAEPPAHRS